jgi:hypothetical protein
MVEVWPYQERNRGIAVFQLFGRLASFFTTFVNPIGLEDVGWRYLISYCCWLAFEVAFVYFMFPETFGRTLEELAFSKSAPLLLSFQRMWLAGLLIHETVFEDKKLADEAVKATEKAIAHHDEDKAGIAVTEKLDAKA